MSRIPRKVRDEFNSPLSQDVDSVVYVTNSGIYVSRKDDPEINFHRFTKREREIIRKLENETGRD